MSLKAFQREYRIQKKEHPSLSRKTLVRIVQDHLKLKKHGG